MARSSIALLVLSLAACGQNRADSEVQAEEPSPPVTSSEAAPTETASAPREESATTEPTDVSSQTEEAGAPTQVLDGTDVVELASLGAPPDEAPPAGTYSAEHGGSTARAVVRPRGDEWSLELTDREPGEPPSRRRYSLRAGSDQYVGDGGIYLRRTREGIAVLEPDAELWVHYVP
jgi:hypothetical protein